jgi:hypothetical protein
MLPALVGACGSSKAAAPNDEPASLDDFCEKCSSCISSPGFDEGFCTPFIVKAMFDRLSCAKSADIAALKNQSFTVSQLQAMTCMEFDHAE